MNSNSHSIDFTEGNIQKKLIKYFLPLLASSFFQQLYTTADAIILGRFAGKNGLASINAVASFLRLPTNFFLGLSAGAAVLISQYFGAREEDDMSKAEHTIICFAFYGGLLMTVLGVATASFWLNLLDVPEEIFPLSLAYVRIYFCGLSVSMLYNVCAGILRAVGDSKTTFYVLVASGITNIVLDLVFVAVLHLNSAGAAAATVLSQLLSAVLILMVLFKTDESYKVSFSKLRIDRTMLKKTVSVGLPIGLQSSLYPVANMVIQSSINATGTDNIAAWGLCGKLDLLFWLVADSMGTTISVFAAQNYGANKYDRARKGVNICLAMTLLLVGLISTALYFWSEPLGRLFLSAEDAGVAKITGDLMHFLAPLYVLYAVGCIYSGAIRGAGKTFITMIITLFGMCVTRFLWVFLVVPRHNTLIMIIACYPISWAVTSLASTVYYQIFKRRGYPVENDSDEKITA